MDNRSLFAATPTAAETQPDLANTEYSLFSYLPTETTISHLQQYEQQTSPLQNTIFHKDPPVLELATSTAAGHYTGVEQDILVGISPLLNDQNTTTVGGQLLEGATHQNTAATSISTSQVAAIGSGVRNTITTSLGTELRMSGHSDTIGNSVITESEPLPSLFGHENTGNNGNCFNIESFLDRLLNDSSVLSTEKPPQESEEKWDASSGDVLIPSGGAQNDVPLAVSYGVPVGGSVIGGGATVTTAVTGSRHASISLASEFMTTAASSGADGISQEGTGTGDSHIGNLTISRGETVMSSISTLQADESCNMDEFIASLVGE
mmetsp:Transcript_21162/g.26159  ORF Transcript_21162/g.26159 Transcript_21162/m.26159 type:complete len:321 (+) Transcript_21162:4581-5543(+)